MVLFYRSPFNYKTSFSLFTLSILYFSIYSSDHCLFSNYLSLSSGHFLFILFLLIFLAITALLPINYSLSNDHCLLFNFYFILTTYYSIDHCLFIYRSLFYYLLFILLYRSLLVVQFFAIYFFIYLIIAFF